VLLVGELQEGDMTVDASTWDADVEGAVEVGAEFSEPFAERFFRADVDSRIGRV
jgi:hypothetical protein